MEKQEETKMEDRRVEIFNEISMVLAEEKLIAPKERIRFLELVQRSNEICRLQ